MTEKEISAHSFWSFLEAYSNVESDHNEVKVYTSDRSNSHWRERFVTRKTMNKRI
jgi:hypothetical protein